MQSNESILFDFLIFFFFSELPTWLDFLKSILRGVIYSEKRYKDRNVFNAREVSELKEKYKFSVNLKQIQELKYLNLRQRNLILLEEGKILNENVKHLMNENDLLKKEINKLQVESKPLEEANKKAVAKIKNLEIQIKYYKSGIESFRKDFQSRESNMSKIIEEFKLKEHYYLKNESFTKPVQIHDLPFISPEYKRELTAVKSQLQESLQKEQYAQNTIKTMAIAMTQAREKEEKMIRTGSNKTPPITVLNLVLGSFEEKAQEMQERNFVYTNLLNSFANKYKELSGHLEVLGFNLNESEQEQMKWALTLKLNQMELNLKYEFEPLMAWKKKVEEFDTQIVENYIGFKQENKVFEDFLENLSKEQKSPEMDRRIKIIEGKLANNKREAKIYLENRKQVIRFYEAFESSVEKKIVQYKLLIDDLFLFFTQYLPTTNLNLKISENIGQKFIEYFKTYQEDVNLLANIYDPNEPAYYLKEYNAEIKRKEIFEDLRADVEKYNFPSLMEIFSETQNLVKNNLSLESFKEILEHINLVFDIVKDDTPRFEISKLGYFNLNNKEDIQSSHKILVKNFLKKVNHQILKCPTDILSQISKLKSAVLDKGKIKITDKTHDLIKSQSDLEKKLLAKIEKSFKNPEFKEKILNYIEKELARENRFIIEKAQIDRHFDKIKKLQLRAELLKGKNKKLKQELLKLNQDIIKNNEETELIRQKQAEQEEKRKNSSNVKTQMVEQVKESLNFLNGLAETKYTTHLFFRSFLTDLKDFFGIYTTDFKFLYIDYKQLDERELKHLFMVTSFFSFLTGSKTNLWLGNELNRRINNQDFTERGKMSKDRLDERFRQTQLQWIESPLKTLKEAANSPKIEGLFYHGILTQINCTRHLKLRLPFMIW